MDKYIEEEWFEEEQAPEYRPDKKRMKDKMGRYLTTSLFLEPNYDPTLAVYTMDGEDKTYKGVVYPSLKRLYLKEGNPIEYNFANKYLYDWSHWKRLVDSKMLGAEIALWREELALLLEEEGVQTIMDAAANEMSFQAGKWLAERGWKKKQGAGRPTKAAIEGNLKEAAHIERIEEEDFSLLQEHLNTDKRLN